MAFEWFTPEVKAELNHISRQNLEKCRREKQAKGKTAERGAVIVPFPLKAKR